MKERLLKVSPSLELPRQFVTHRNAVLGMSGSGKSNALTVLAEEMFAAELPWIMIDPKGDAFGIRSSADGKRAGLDVPIFGGDHGDLPLSPKNGKRMGELAASDKITGIFDLSGFETDAERARFMADFGRALFRGRHTPIHVFCDECHEYMQQPGAGGRLEGPAAECVGVWKRILTQGRQRGIGVTLASQRTAHVNKTCLYQCETLLAFRTMGKLDRKAIQDWVDQVGDARELLEALPRLADGEAFVWSPMRLKVEKRVLFRRRSTFDSGRTPEVGEEAVAPKLADIDIAALRAELEEPEPEAPTDTGAGPVAEALVRVERERDAARKELSETRQALDYCATAMRSIIQLGLKALDLVPKELRGYVPPVDAATLHVEAPSSIEATPAKPRIPRIEHPEYSGQARARGLPQRGEAPKGESAVLAALAQHPNGCTKKQLRILTSYRRSTLDTYLQRLRAAEAVKYDGDRITITVAGRRQLPADCKALPRGGALRQHYLQTLPEGEAKLLEHLLKAYPSALSRDVLTERTGYARSTRDTYLQRLKARELVESLGGNVRAAEGLFE